MLYAVSRSLWVDSSIAELHTFSMALAALLLLLGLRAAENPTPRSDLGNYTFLCCTSRSTKAMQFTVFLKSRAITRC